MVGQGVVEGIERLETGLSFHDAAQPLHLPDAWPLDWGRSRRAGYGRILFDGQEGIAQAALVVSDVSEMLSKVA